MRLMLSGEAAPEAAGALLMLMRYRGETAAEIAGFVDAIRDRTKAWANIGAALDWPSYAAGRSRGLPWFLLSVKLVASAGPPILIHGWNSHQQGAADVREALACLNIPITTTPQSAASTLAKGGVAYAPLEAIEAEVFRLLRLRDVLGLRSAINTCLRVLNPSHAPTTVQGVFHPSYRLLQQEAGALLGQRHQLVLKGGGGEFERHPSKPIALFGLKEGASFEAEAASLIEDKRRLADADPSPANLEALWTGEYTNPFAEAVVLGTAALALFALRRTESVEQAEKLAEDLWRQRQSRAAA